jgi:hypothetical protein
LPHDARQYPAPSGRQLALDQRLRERHLAAAAANRTPPYAHRPFDASREKRAKIRSRKRFSMHIEREPKLDFADVLIRPKRSALPSRAAKWTSTGSSRSSIRGRKYRGIPIVAANMDTVGTFEMARALAPFGLSVALHKHYPDSDLAAFFRALEVKSSAFYSMGITKADEEKFERVLGEVGDAIGLRLASTSPTGIPRRSCASSSASGPHTRSSRSWPATSSPAR